MIHLNGHKLCVIDVETTGIYCDRHEITEICILPLDFTLKPQKKVPVFNILMKPDKEENIDWNAFKVTKKSFFELCQKGMTQDEGANLFETWFEKLGLEPDKRIIPLAHNWQFDKGFIENWLGCKSYGVYFDGRFRDTMAIANYLNDKADLQGNRHPFPKVKLGYLASQLKLEHDESSAHTAIGDCLTTLEVYRALLNRLI